MENGLHLVTLARAEQGAGIMASDAVLPSCGVNLDLVLEASRVQLA